MWDGGQLPEDDLSEQVESGKGVGGPGGPKGTKTQLLAPIQPSKHT